MVIYSWYNTWEGDDLMKRLYLIFVIITLVSLLSACSNEQIQEAIDQCKDDPECVEIIDDVIDEELESRGITGGKMTGEEMLNIYKLYTDMKIDLEVIQYYSKYDKPMYNSNMDPEPPLEEIEMGYLLNFIYSNMIDPETYDGGNQHLKDLQTQLQFQVKLHDMKIEELYETGKQFLTENKEKHCIFKIGVDRYKYEIATPGYKEEYIIDLTFNSFGPVTRTSDDFYNDITSIDRLSFSDLHVSYYVTTSNSIQYRFLSEGLYLDCVFWINGKNVDFGGSIAFYDEDGFSIEDINMTDIQSLIGLEESETINFADILSYISEQFDNNEKNLLFDALDLINEQDYMDLLTEH